MNIDTTAFQRVDTSRVVNGGNDAIEVDRLIINEAISKAGYDFVEMFEAAWNWPEPSTETFTMVIMERPYRGISTQILIIINDLVVFESFLQSRYEYLEFLTGMAVEQAASYVFNYQDIMKQLEGADVKGTGIY